MRIVDENIEPEVRQKMAEKLNQAQVPEQFETGYEALPDIAGFNDMSRLDWAKFLVLTETGKY